MKVKYYVENGILKYSPVNQNDSQTKTVAYPNQSLTIVSSAENLINPVEDRTNKKEVSLQLSELTISSVENIQTPSFLQKFSAPEAIDGGALFDGLSGFFQAYEIPIGLLNKLMMLSGYKLNFIMDDSGSMALKSDTTMGQSCEFMKAKNKNRTLEDTITRWEEAQDRLHVMMDILSYIPTNGIIISFLNRPNKLVLDQRGKTPQAFADEAHKKISDIFSSPPAGKTPLYNILNQSFNNSTGKTMHYVFTDGQPTDRTPAETAKLVMMRKNAFDNPLTFISCTNDDDEAQWMKDIEERAPFTAEIDDFYSERKEVAKKQGPVFPYSRGMWLMCQVVAAINPDDLDALDETLPLTKYSLDNLMGRILSPQEYRTYFVSHPQAKTYESVYESFSTCFCAARFIKKLENADPCPLL